MQQQQPLPGNPDIEKLASSPCSHSRCCESRVLQVLWALGDRGLGGESGGEGDERGLSGSSVSDSGEFATGLAAGAGVGGAGVPGSEKAGNGGAGDMLHMLNRSEKDSVALLVLFALDDL